MKIVFISVTGVLFKSSDLLNYSLWQQSAEGQKFLGTFPEHSIERSIKGSEFFSKEAISFLLKLVKENNAGIVIVSGWQYRRTLDDIKVIFKNTGLSDYIVGKTYLKDPADFLDLEDYKDYANSISYNYEKQIQNWLEEQTTVTEKIDSYLVISQHDHQLKDTFGDKYISVGDYGFDKGAFEKASTKLKDLVKSVNISDLAESLGSAFNNEKSILDDHPTMEIDSSIPKMEY